MLELPRLALYFAIIVVTFLGCELALRATKSRQGCTVVITGESVKIIGCEFTGSFIEYAKNLKPANHW